MAHFNQRPGTRSAILRFRNPVQDITRFDSIVQELVLQNPLGCTSYRSVKHHHPPVEIVREMYTAKFEYKDGAGKRIGTGSEVYNSVEGYQTGIAAVISNMANIASHRGKVKHMPGADLFSVILKCHDPHNGFSFLSLARNRIPLSSYTDDAIRERLVKWTRGKPELA